MFSQTQPKEIYCHTITCKVKSNGFFEAYTKIYWIAPQTSCLGINVQDIIDLIKIIWHWNPFLQEMI